MVNWGDSNDGIGDSNDGIGDSNGELEIAMENLSY